MQQATNTPQKGTKKQPCTDFLINTKTHAIPELLLSNADLNEQTQLFHTLNILNQCIF